MTSPEWIPRAKPSATAGIPNVPGVIGCQIGKSSPTSGALNLGPRTLLANSRALATEGWLRSNSASRATSGWRGGALEWLAKWNSGAVGGGGLALTLPASDGRADSEGGSLTSTATGSATAVPVPTGAVPAELFGSTSASPSWEFSRTWAN